MDKSHKNISNRKINYSEYKNIYEKICNKEPVEQIAKEYNVARSTISKIKTKWEKDSPEKELIGIRKIEEIIKNLNLNYKLVKISDE